MKAAVRQSVQRSQWLTELAQLGQRIGELASPLDRRQLDWSPPEGGWGAGQLLEHLCLANDSYVDRIRTAMYHAQARLPTDDPDWRPSLLGSWLARSITPGTRKLPAPRMYQPAPVARPGVLEAFLHGQRALVELLDTASRFDLARSRTRSPVSRLIRLNLGDCSPYPSCTSSDTCNSSNGFAAITRFPAGSERFARGVYRCAGAHQHCSPAQTCVCALQAT